MVKIGSQLQSWFLVEQINSVVNDGLQFGSRPLLGTQRRKIQTAGDDEALDSVPV
jgi:hypothetical protein